jgi:integrase
MASFEKVTGGWRAHIARRGVRKSETFETKAKAQAWAGEIEAAILNGTYRDPNAEPTAEETTIRELFRRYSQRVSANKLGARWEQTRINAFLRDNEAIAEMRLSKCTSNVFGEWRDDRLGQVSAGTVIRELNLYSNIFTTARDEWGLIEKSPISKVRRPKQPQGRDRRISADEQEKILFALGYEPKQTPTTVSARIAVVWLFAIETGARAGEIVGLTWDRVYLQQKRIHLNKTKMGFARDVALAPRAIELIQQVGTLRDKKNRHDPVFKVTGAQVDALYRKARDRCKIEDLHFHDARHEACTRLAKKLPMLALARMLGIRDLDILQIYYNETASEMAEILATAA